MTDSLNLIAISVGNTRTACALFEGGKQERTERFDNADLPAMVEQITQWWQQIAATPRAALALASVNDPLADRLALTLEDQLSVEVYRVNHDLPIPIGVQLDPETITGVDRLPDVARRQLNLADALLVVNALLLRVQR